MASSFFISHGAPDLALRDTPAAAFLRGFGAELADARAILVVSAHWETATPCLTGHPAPETIHDFWGFPPALNALRYPAPGNPALAARVAALVPGGSVDPMRGFDHGAWSPLILALPEANIPVVQLSVQSHMDAGYHYEMGRRLAPLKDEGVVVIGSGSVTHNLRAIKPSPVPLPQAAAFSDWLYEALTRGDLDALLNWRSAPHADWNHPTPEHFLPLFVALGAAGEGFQARRLHAGLDLGALSMDSYAF